jgi:hypothetical protein
MALIDIRTKFIQLSGRFDLVVSPITFTPDNGADFFIKAGQRLLDNLQDTKFFWYKKNLTAGQGVIDVPYLRVVKEVWLANAEGRSQLEKKSLGWIRENYGEPFSAQDRGTPIYWAQGVNQLSIAQEALTTANYTTEFTYGADDLIFSDELSGGHHYTSLLLAPVSNVTSTLEVLGKFFGSLLTADTSKSFWTEQYPEVLVRAALYQLEVFYRNTEGAKDWRTAIEEDIMGIDHNLVDEQITGLTQLDG